jgi:hypothetical protein
LVPHASSPPLPFLDVLLFNYPLVFGDLTQPIPKEAVADFAG